MSFALSDLRRPCLAAMLAAACAAGVVGGCGGSDDEGGNDDAAVVSDADTTDAQPKEGDGKGGTANEGGATESTGDGEAPGGGPTLTGDREQARTGAAAVAGVYDDLAAAVEAGIGNVEVPLRDTLDDADANQGLSDMCALTSERGQQQTIAYAKRASGIADVTWTCEKAMAVLVRRARHAGGLNRSLKATVVGVNANGNRATATVRFGGPGGQTSTIPLVKEDGGWKLADSAAGGGG